MRNGLALRNAQNRLKVAELLPRAAQLYKLADLGGEPKREFEKTFAALAYVYQADKAPILKDRMVGFQLLDSSDDKQRAAGVFAYQAGPLTLFAPVFFINGRIKGHELMYVKELKQFVPFKESWVNDLLNRRPMQLGEGVSPNTMGRARYPNYSQVLGSPTSSTKYAADSRTIAADFLREMQPHIIHDMSRLAKVASFREFCQIALPSRNLVAKLLSSNVKAAALAVRWSENNPTFRFLLDQLGGNTLLKQALLSLRKQYETPPRVLQPWQPKQASAAPELEILYRGQVDTDREKRASLDDASKQRLLRDGVLIRDNRPAEKIATVYPTRVPQIFTNPSETGIYKVLMRDGSFGRCLVIDSGVHGEGSADFLTVVDIGSRKWANVRRQNVFVESQEPASEFKTWANQQAKASDFSDDECYVAFTENGVGTVPFTVRDGSGDSSWQVSYERGLRGDNQPVPSGALHYAMPSSGFDSTVTATGKNGGRIQGRNGHLFLPDAARKFSVECPWEPNKGSSSPLALGDADTVDNSLRRALDKVTIETDNIEYHIDDLLFPGKTAALVYLVKDACLREDVARGLLNEAAKGRFVQRYIKRADPYLSDSQPDAPVIPDVPVGSMSGPNHSVPMVSTMEMDIPNNSLQHTHALPTTYDPWFGMQDDPYHQNSVQAATDTASLGNTDTLDTLSLTMLLKSMSNERLIDENLPELMQALNSLGRLLFTFRWHTNDFEDRYGKQDMPELEDALVNAFDAVGDVTLFLKNKSVYPAGGYEGSADLSALAQA